MIKIDNYNGRSVGCNVVKSGARGEERRCEKGEGGGEEGKGSSKSVCVRRSSPFAPSLFRLSPYPFPPETPDTQAKSGHHPDPLFTEVQ